MYSLFLFTPIMKINDIKQSTYMYVPISLISQGSHTTLKGIIKLLNMPSYLHGSIEVKLRIIFDFIHTC